MAQEGERAGCSWGDRARPARARARRAGRTRPRCGHAGRARVGPDTGRIGRRDAELVEPVGPDLRRRPCRPSGRSAPSPPRPAPAPSARPPCRPRREPARPRRSPAASRRPRTTAPRLAAPRRRPCCPAPRRRRCRPAPRPAAARRSARARDAGERVPSVRTTTTRPAHRGPRHAREHRAPAHAARRDRRVVGIAAVAEEDDLGERLEAPSVEAQRARRDAPRRRRRRRCGMRSAARAAPSAPYRLAVAGGASACRREAAGVSGAAGTVPPVGSWA